MRRLSLRWVVGCVLWTLGQLFTSLVPAEAIEKYLIKASRENKLIKLSFVAAGACSSNRHENWPT
jgi:hypothetical protein